MKKNPEKTGEKLKKLAKEVDLKIKKSDAETADQFASVLESRMETFKIPAFSRLQSETQKNTVGGVLGECWASAKNSKNPPIIHKIFATMLENRLKQR